MYSDFFPWFSLCWYSTNTVPLFFNSFKMGVQNFEITFQGGEPDERMVFNGGSTIVGTVRFIIDEKPKDTRGGL